MRWLFVIFVVLPMVDLWFLLGLGQLLGFWATLGLTLGAAAFGAYLGKREGMKVLRQWREAMAQLRMPEDGLVSAALVLAGAVLLASPGVLTDVLGFAFLLPFTRRPIANFVRRRLELRMQRAVQSGSLRVNVVSFQSGRTSPRTQDVVDTELEVIPAEPKALPPAREN